MGLRKNQNKVFLRISEGKIRQKSNKEDREAEERYTEIDGKFHYERVFNSCSGYVRGISVHIHSDYGTTYNLELFDPSDQQTFSLGIAENSRYFTSLATHLPNIDFALPVVVTPFSFKQEGNNRIGISFKQNDEKVANYYIVDSGEGEFERIHGMEQFDFSEAEDKDERKIIGIKMAKFLKAELKKQIIRLEKYVEENPKPVQPADEKDESNNKASDAKGTDKKEPDVDISGADERARKRTSTKAGKGKGKGSAKTTAKDKKSKSSSKKSSRSKKGSKDNEDLPF